MDDKTMTDLAMRITAAEVGLVELYRQVARECPNTHQAHRNLELAQSHFEDGFTRLGQAVAPSSVWPVRHG